MSEIHFLVPMNFGELQAGKVWELRATWCAFGKALAMKRDLLKRDSKGRNPVGRKWERTANAEILGCTHARLAWKEGEAGDWSGMSKVGQEGESTGRR